MAAAAGAEVEAMGAVGAETTAAEAVAGPEAEAIVAAEAGVEVVTPLSAVAPLDSAARRLGWGTIRERIEVRPEATRERLRVVCELINRRVWISNAVPV